MHENKIKFLKDEIIETKPYQGTFKPKFKHL